MVDWVIELPVGAQPAATAFVPPAWPACNLSHIYLMAHLPGLPGSLASFAIHLISDKA